MQLLAFSASQSADSGKIPKISSAESLDPARTCRKKILIKLKSKIEKIQYYLKLLAFLAYLILNKRYNCLCVHF